MTDQRNLVIPDPEHLGVRVTPRTSLGQIVGALRKHNPKATANELLAAAMQLQRSSTSQRPPEPVVEVPEPAAEPAPKPRRRRKTEADASMVPVDGGAPIPAEPPARW